MTDNPQRFDGLEADWLAVDGAGHVAFITAAGHGPVPAAVGDAARHRDAIASVRSLPATSSISLVPLFPLDEGTDWQEMARRGIYAFDADHDGYHLRAAPDQPAPVSSLPPAVAQVARSVACRHLTFSGTRVISFPDAAGAAADTPGAPRLRPSHPAAAVQERGAVRSALHRIHRPPPKPLVSPNRQQIHRRQHRHRRPQVTEHQQRTARAQAMAITDRRSRPSSPSSRPHRAAAPSNQARGSGR
jgi:hypothetical protein